MITQDDIERAAGRIGTYVRRTPVVELEAGALGSAAALVLKLELLQHAGSFKPRGAFNTMLSAASIPEAGVIAASGGNHGAAVAYAARQLGHAAEIFVPQPTPEVKVDRLRRFGARVTQTGASYAEAYVASQARAAQTGALQIHAYDQPEVLAGQGTLARELEAQARDLDTAIVAVGGGGLIGGIAAWLRNRVRVIAVEPQSCPTLYRALESGVAVDVDVGGIAADSLGARRIGALALEVAQRYVDSAVLVSDDDIRQAQRALWDSARILAEPGGATAMAAICGNHYRPAPGERVAVVVCGGNVDPGKFAA